MNSQKPAFAQLKPEERQAIVDTIKSYDIKHKEIIVELFEFVEALIKDLKNSKITLSVLKSRLAGFVSEQTKKANQTQ